MIQTAASQDLGRTYLSVDPRVCHGKLTFKGTRVPVETILLRLAKGRSVEAILTDWPELDREAVEAVAALVDWSDATTREDGGVEPVHPGRPD